MSKCIAGVITVAYEFSEDDVQISDCGISDGPVDPGDPVAVEFDVENANDAVAVVEVDVIRNNTVVNTFNFEVGGNTLEGRIYNDSIHEPGEYEYNVELVSAERA